MKLLRVWIGCMGSAKTTSALHAAQRYQRVGKRVLLVRPTRSVRSNETQELLITRTQSSFKAMCVDRPPEILWYSSEYDVVWVDEPALFTDEDDLYDTVQEIRKKQIVLVSGLCSTVDVAPFGISTPKIVAVADEVNHLKADCDCCGGCGIATRTLLINGEQVDGIKIGGCEAYCAVCPNCWEAFMTIPVESRKGYLLSHPMTTKLVTK